MSCLEKLSISGIRSFDPENRQVIFFHPLTIILGINGAGKTTIIECLRYLASNEFPPNSKQGKTWIHEAAQKKSHTVRAQVKLAFNDVHQEKCVVTKSFQMTTSCDKNGKITSRIRTLDAIIKRGDNTLVSSKCADINAIILELIGVSKAVITNVIFCHQEDSNWPLSEGKVLKEKFDEIFGSIGYVKALKRIKDLRNEYCKLQAINETELKLYSEQKNQVEKYEAELVKNETTLASHKSAIAVLNQELMPIQKDLETIVLKEQILIEIERKISELKGQINEQKKNYNYLKSNIKKEFNGSEQELNQALVEFENNLLSQFEKKQLAESKLEKMQQDLKLFNEEQNKLTLTKFKLDHCQEEYFKSLKIGKEMVANIMTDDGIIEIAHHLIKKINVEDDQIDQFRQVCSLFFDLSQHLQNQYNQVNSQFNVEIDHIDKQIDNFKSNKSKLEHSLKINQNSIDLANQEIIDLKAKLKAINDSSVLVSLLKKQIQDLNKKLSELQSNVNVNELILKINQLQNSQDQIKLEIEELNKEKDRLQCLNENQAVLNLLISNRSKEKENLNLIYSQNFSFMQKLCIVEMNFDKSFSHELQNLINCLDCSINSLENKLENLNNDHRIKEHDFNLEKLKLDNIKKDIQIKENQIKIFCDGDDYETALEDLDKEVKILREKKSNYLAAETILTDYCNIIKEEDKCPVCCQDILEESKKFSIINHLKLQIDQVPEQTKSIVTKLEKKEELYNQLLGLTSDNQFVKNSKQELPKLNSLVSLLKSELTLICSEMEKINNELKKEKFELKKLKLLESDAVKYDHSMETIIKLDKEINELKRKNHIFSDNNDLMENEKTLNDVKDELELKINQLKKTEKELRKIQEAKEDYNQKASELNLKIITIEKEKLDLEKNQQKNISFQDKIDDLKIKLSTCNEMIVKDNQNLEKVKSRLDDFNAKKSQLSLEQKFKLNKINALLSKVSKHQSELDTIVKDIEQYFSKSIDSKLSELNKNFDQVKKKIENVNIKIDDEIKLIKKCESEINEAEIRKRDLKDNLALIKCSQVLSEFSKQLKLEEEKRGCKDNLGLLKKKQELEKLCSDKLQKVQHLKGRQEPIILKNNEIKQELKKEKYKNARENYRRKKIDLVVIKMLCDDLNKYYKALDHSVIIYHNKKMEEINRLVYKLWKQTYRGTDIDYIKIVSDENDERSAEDKRKTFNYRVVMVKNGYDMDMRGRCSAGQKVIASLVIRLALAEIFCINCGILALDEPTTNLDNENIKAFADAVIDIVESHRFHRFQLLIITHDEQFLRCLNESSNEYYYKIDKNDNGFSKITRYSIRERDD